MMAAPNPISIKISRKAVMTVATAIVPNADGDTLRARMAVMPNEINTHEYLATAIQNTPLAISCLIDDIEISYLVLGVSHKNVYLNKSHMPYFSYTAFI